MRSRRGSTLTELLAASTIGAVVLLTLGQMDVARVRMYEYIRHGSTAQPTNSESGFALADILGDLKQADRVVLLGAEPAHDLLIRIPGDGNLDDSSNYIWKQYRLEGDQILRYDEMRCAEPTAYHGVSGLQVQYVNVANSTLGDEPFPSGSDNNVVRVTVSYGEQRKVWGVATIPAASYTNLNAVCSGTECDSGEGLAPNSQENPERWAHPDPCTT